MKSQELKNCTGCNVEPNQTHKSGCGVERCSVCKGQRLMCEMENGTCQNKPGHMHNPEKAIWTGYWPGVLECQKLGWYSVLLNVNEKWGAGHDIRGWVPCHPSEPEATEDLNRFAIYQQTGIDPFRGKFSYPQE